MKIKYKYIVGIISCENGQDHGVRLWGACMSVARATLYAWALGAENPMKCLPWAIYIDNISLCLHFFLFFIQGLFNWQKTNINNINFKIFNLTKSNYI